MSGRGHARASTTSPIALHASAQAHLVPTLLRIGIIEQLYAHASIVGIPTCPAFPNKIVELHVPSPLSRSAPHLRSPMRRMPVRMPYLPIPKRCSPTDSTSAPEPCPWQRAYAINRPKMERTSISHLTHAFPHRDEKSFAKRNQGWCIRAMRRSFTACVSSGSVKHKASVCFIAMQADLILASMRRTRRRRGPSFWHATGCAKLKVRQQHRYRLCMRPDGL